MKGTGAGHIVQRALATVVVSSLVLFPLAQTAAAAVPSASGSGTAGASADQTSSAANAAPVTWDSSFLPLPNYGLSPWDNEPIFTGIDGKGYSNPGFTVKVRDMSSVAFFVDEVWLVYPKVQYLFNNKDVLPPCNVRRTEHGITFVPGRNDNQCNADPLVQDKTFLFSAEISVGTFPQGTELVFAHRTGVGIDNACQDRVKKYKWNGVGAPPQGVQNVDNPTDPGDLVNFEARDYSNTDDQWKLDTLAALLRNGNTQWTDVSAQRIVMDTHHCFAGTHVDPAFVPNTASFTPFAPDPLAACAAADAACWNRAWPRLTPDGHSVFYTGPGVRNPDGQPHGRFQFLAAGVGLFGLEDSGLCVPTSTPIAGESCSRHPDFNDSGIVVTPVLTGTCSPTATANVVQISGQPGYDAIELRTPETAPSTSLGFYVPGDRITFVKDLNATTPTVTPTPDATSVQRAAKSFTITLAGKAMMAFTDPTAPAQVPLIDNVTKQPVRDQLGNVVLVDNPLRTITGGVCFDPQWPPVTPLTGNLTPPTCSQGAVWDFTISNTVDPNASPAGVPIDRQAPPSVRVAWTGGETATVPLSSWVQTSAAGVTPGVGIAHYTTALHTDPSQGSTNVTLTVTTLTGQISGTWSGEFKISAAPCPPPPAHADVSLACAISSTTPWDISLSGTTAAQAPASIKVTWSGGVQGDVPLSGTVGADGVAHYTSSQHLDLSIVDATAKIEGQWSGQFKVNGAKCPAKRTLSLTAIPSCTDGVTAWDITISNMTSALAPQSVLATWAGSAPEPVALTSVDATTGLAHYTTTAHTGTSYASLTSITAEITFASDADATAFTGSVAVPGVPCRPPAPTPSPSAPIGGCVPIYNPAGKHIPDAGENPRSGQNPDGFYLLLSQPGGSVRVKDTQSAYVTPAWPHGTTIKLTEANGRTPTFWTGPGAVNYEVRLTGDAEVWMYTNPTGTGAPANKVTCFVPNHPKGPGESPSPSTSPSPSPSSPTDVHVKPSTLTDHSCDSTEWHFVINQITEATAPASIHVYWANGKDAVVPLEKVSGGVAHYRTTLYLDSVVIDATASIAGSFGQFNLSHGPCNSSPTPSPESSRTPEPSQSTPPAASTPPPSSGGVHVKVSTLSDHSCDASSWHFVITGTSTAQAPGAIVVKWGDLTGLAMRQSVSGGTAHYRTTANLTRAVTDAVATIGSGWSGQFNVSSGPCNVSADAAPLVIVGTAPVAL